MNPTDPIVCILSGVPLSGGGQYALASRMTTLATDIARAGFETLLIAPDGRWSSNQGLAQLESPPADSGAKRTARPQANTLGISDSFRVFVKALRTLRGISSGRKMVIVSSGIWLPLLSRLLAALHGDTITHLDVPGIPALEIQLSKPRYWRAKVAVYEYIFRNAARHAGVVTTINERHAELLRQRYDADPLVIPDLLKEDWLHRLSSLPEPTQGENVSILYLGALFGSRIDSFLDALVRILTGGRTRAVIVGDGPDKARYQSEYSHDRLVFLGFVSRETVLSQLAAADLCYSDVWHGIGTPYKILEYMAAGRAVVSHDTGSLRETITDGVDGILCSEDVDSLARALQKLVDDAALRRRLGIEARRRTLRLHAGDRIRGLAALYRRRFEA